MENVTKKCAICGTLFTTKYPQQKYCDEQCYKVSQIKRSKNWRLRQKREAEIKAAKNTGTDWAEIVRKCEAAGLSYGEAVAKGVI